MILRNSLRCRQCGDEIVSLSRHDWVSCSCGNISVDGGRDYFHWGWIGPGPLDFFAEDTSITKTWATVEEWLSDFVNVHPAFQCAGDHCTIHNPSDHHMRDWEIDWQGRIVRRCAHDVWHPDPDGLDTKCWVCDGCCVAP